MDDKEVVLLFHKRRRKVTIKYDPKILVLVLNINLGILNYQVFSKVFYSIIYNDSINVENDTISINNTCEDMKNGVALRAINVKPYLN